MTEKLHKIAAHLTDLEEKLSDIAEQVALLADKKDDKEPKQEGGTIEPVEAGEGDPKRVTIEGSCDEGNTLTVISQTNGKDDTIMYPKNVGSCGNVVIFCRDSLDRKNDTSEIVLGPGKSIRRYDSGRNTHSIVFFCDGKKGACKLEFDR